MRAAVIAQPGSVEIVDAPIPQPGPNEARIRLEGCGVCASNLPPWEGREWFTYPMGPGALGHEGWGYVDAIGANITDLAVGDRVASLGQKAYAEYDIATRDALVRLPETLAGPFPGEPLGCALNIFRRSQIRAGETVAIVGIGFLGALLVGLAKNVGARVIAIARRPYALEVARAYGADETIVMDDHYAIIQRVKELTGGNFCECVVEAVGKQWPLDLSAELTAIRGRLIVAGYHQDGLRQVNMQLWNWRGLDVINAHERDPMRYTDGIRDAMDAVVNGAIDPEPLYTHRFPLNGLGAALDITAQRPDGFMKAWITYPAVEA